MYYLPERRWKYPRISHAALKKQAIWHIMRIYYHYGYFNALEIIVIVFRVWCKIFTKT